MFRTHRVCARRAVGMAVAIFLLVPGGAATGAEPAAAPAAAAPRNDYPTYERVRYVLQCIERNGGAPALMYQCSCAIDRVAERYSFDDFVEMQTALNGSTIAGERGGVVRDNPDMRADARKYREAEAAALKSCGVAAKR